MVIPEVTPFDNTSRFDVHDMGATTDGRGARWTNPHRINPDSRAPQAFVTPDSVRVA